MRNSWLALATKSTRMRSSRRAAVTSRNNITISIAPLAPPAGSASIRTGVARTSKLRSTGTFSWNSVSATVPSRSTRSTALTTSGERTAKLKERPMTSWGRAAFACALNMITLPCESSTTTGSAMPDMIAWMPARAVSWERAISAATAMLGARPHERHDRGDERADERRQEEGRSAEGEDTGDEQGRRKSAGRGAPAPAALGRGPYLLLSCRDHGELLPLRILPLRSVRRF